MFKHSSLICVILVSFSFINAVDIYEMELFVEAAHTGQMNQVGLLLYQGVDIDYTDKDGYTALMAASSGGYLNIVQYLIDHDASLDLQNTALDGRTALMYACVAKKWDVAKYLIASGADVNILDYRAQNALVLCSSNSQILQLLIENGALLPPLIVGK